jgi:hypothetical protein
LRDVPEGIDLDLYVCRRRIDKGKSKTKERSGVSHLSAFRKCDPPTQKGTTFNGFWYCKSEGWARGAWKSHPKKQQKADVQLSRPKR